MLPELPDLGIWRLESHGFYAAVELAGAARFLAIASASGLNVPARLRLDQREKKIPGKATNRYAVPVIEFTTMRITDLLTASRTGQPLALDGTGPVAQLAPGETPAAPVTPPPAPVAPRPSTPAEARRQRTDRPPLGPAPEVPDGSDFRKPTPQPPAASTPQTPPAAEPPAQPPTVATVTEETESLGGWAIDPEPPAAAAPVSDVHPLVAQIQAAIAAGTAKGPMEAQAKAAVFERIMTPVGAGPFRTVVIRAIGEDAFKKPSAREAAGLLEVAAGFVDEAELVSVWRSAAASIAGPPT
jgi:hypothetical protein